MLCLYCDDGPAFVQRQLRRLPPTFVVRRCLQSKSIRFSSFSTNNSSKCAVVRHIKDFAVESNEALSTETLPVLGIFLASCGSHALQRYSNRRVLPSKILEAHVAPNDVILALGGRQSHEEISSHQLEGGIKSQSQRSSDRRILFFCFFVL